MADSSLIRQRALYDRGGISLVELEGFEREASRPRRDLEDLSVRKSLNRQERNRLAQLHLELEEDRSQWLTDQRIVLQRSLFELRTSLQEWVLEYVWTAPVSGTVYIAGNRIAGDPVVAGELLFTVLPERGNIQWYGEMVITEAGVGKVRPDLEVEISLDGYPAAEYGLVEGKVQAVSMLPEEGFYRLDIAAPTPLVTSYRDTIPVRPVLLGKAAVITEKRNLLSRIFDRVRAGF